MGRPNRKIMQIAKEVLSEKNYTGTRLIEITDERVLELKKEMDKLQMEMKPLLEQIKPEWDSLDKSFPALKDAQDALKVVQDERAPVLDKCRKFETDFLMPIEQKAQLIKDKLQPLILDIVKGELSEFETARQTVDKDGKVYVEVIDEIEEKVKAIREAKAKK